MMWRYFGLTSHEEQFTCTWGLSHARQWETDVKFTHLEAGHSKKDQDVVSLIHVISQTRTACRLQTQANYCFNYYSERPTLGKRMKYHQINRNILRMSLWFVT